MCRNVKNHSKVEPCDIYIIQAMGRADSSDGTLTIKPLEVKGEKNRFGYQTPQEEEFFNKQPNDRCIQPNESPGPNPLIDPHYCPSKTKQCPYKGTIQET